MSTNINICVDIPIIFLVVNYSKIIRMYNYVIMSAKILMQDDRPFISVSNISVLYM